jgi:hypothetical protein
VLTCAPTSTDSGTTRSRRSRRPWSRGRHHEHDHHRRTRDRTIVVDGSIERAFEIFTADIGSWSPTSHHILKAELAEMVFEPRVGGHIIDRGVDGSE